MKLITSIIVTLLIGIFVGRFWGGSTTSEDAVKLQEPSVALTPSRVDTPSRIKSEPSGRNFERELSENGIQTDGVFGKIAVQIQRYQTMNNSAFEKEVDYLSKHSSSDGYSVSYYLLFTAWGEKDPDAALNFLESSENLSNQTKKYVGRVVYKSWIAKNPSSAIANVESSDYLENDKLTRHDKIKTIADEWMKQDPDAAFNWLKNLDSKDKEPALLGFFSNLVKHDSSEAIEKLSQLKAKDRHAALNEIAEHWGETMDWKEVQSQITSLPGSSKEMAELRALKYYIPKKPYEATEIISDLDIPKKDKYSLVDAVVRKIGKKDPANTLDWALSNLDGKNQLRIAKYTFSPWASEFPDKAAEWLITQPNDDVTSYMYNQITKNKSTPKDVKSSLQSHFEKNK